MKKQRKFKKVKSIRIEMTLSDLLIQEFLEGRGLDAHTKAIYEKRENLRHKLLQTIDGRERKLFDEIEELQAREQTFQLDRFVDFMFEIFHLEIDKNALLKNIL